jgi:hypothetical protein
VRETPPHRDAENPGYLCSSIIELRISDERLFTPAPSQINIFVLMLATFLPGKNDVCVSEQGRCTPKGKGREGWKVANPPRSKLKRKNQVL